MKQRTLPLGFSTTKGSLLPFTIIVHSKTFLRVGDGDNVHDPGRVVPDFPGVPWELTDQVRDGPPHVAAHTHALGGLLYILQQQLVAENVHCGLVVEEHPCFRQPAIKLRKLEQFLDHELLHALH